MMATFIEINDSALCFSRRFAFYFLYSWNTSRRLGSDVTNNIDVLYYITRIVRILIHFLVVLFPGKCVCVSLFESIDRGRGIIRDGF